MWQKCSSSFFIGTNYIFLNMYVSIFSYPAVTVNIRLSGPAYTEKVSLFTNLFASPG